MPIFPEVTEQENPPAVGTDLLIFVAISADADVDLWLILDDLPVNEPQRKPPIVNTQRVLEGVTDEINDIHRISAVVGFLDQNVHVGFSLRPLGSLKRHLELQR